MLAKGKSGGKGDMRSAVCAAKEKLWKDIMYMWCTYMWLMDRVEQIQSSF